MFARSARPRVVLVTLYLLLMSGRHTCLAQRSYRIEEIQKSWKTREEKVLSARFSWTEKMFVPGGSLRSNPKDRNQNVPPEDEYQVYKSSLVFSGSDVCYSSWRPVWSYVLNKYIEQDVKENQFKEQCKEFFGNIGNDGFFPVHPLAFVRRKQEHQSIAGSHHIQPILLHLRPTQFKLIDWNSVKLLKTPLIIHGKASAVLEKLETNVRDRLILDPDKEYSVLRHELTVGDKLVFESDLAYKLDEQYGWLPASWSSTIYRRRDGSVREGSRAVVIKIELNPKISDDELDIKFPIGTDVKDEVNGGRYILTKDWKKRVVTREESARSATYDELMNSTSGESGRTKLNP